MDSQISLFQHAISISSLYFVESGPVLNLSSFNSLGILILTHGLHAAILGKKCISILGFGNKPSCACSICLRVRNTMDNHYIKNDNGAIPLRSHFKA